MKFHCVRSHSLKKGLENLANQWDKLFDQILHLLDCRAVTVLCLDQTADLLGNIGCLIVICSPDGLGSLEDGVDDLFHVERHLSAVTLGNVHQHLNPSA